MEKWCLHDYRNSAFVKVPHILPLSTSMHYVTHNPLTVSDWLNPHYLGTLAAFRCIDKLNKKSA